MSEQSDRPNDAQAQDAEYQANILHSAGFSTSNIPLNPQQHTSESSSTLQRYAINATQHDQPAFTFLGDPHVTPQEGSAVSLDIVGSSGSIDVGFDDFNEVFTQPSQEFQSALMDQPLKHPSQRPRSTLYRAYTDPRLSTSSVHHNQGNRTHTTSIPPSGGSLFAQPHIPSTQLGFNEPSIGGFSDSLPHRYPWPVTDKCTGPYYQQSRYQEGHSTYQQPNINPRHNPHPEYSIQNSHSFLSPPMSASPPPPIPFFNTYPTVDTQPGALDREHDEIYASIRVCDCNRNQDYTGYTHQVFPPTTSHFTTWVEASAALDQCTWQTKEPDPTIPITDQEKLAWVRRVYWAITDDSHFHDAKVATFHPKTNRVNDRRPHFVKGRFHQRDIELGAWRLVDQAIQLHTHGATANRVLDPTQHNSEEEFRQNARIGARNLSFEERMKRICFWARVEKTCATEIVLGENLVKMIYHPDEHGKSKGNNKKGNTIKKKKLNEYDEMMEQGLIIGDVEGGALGDDEEGSMVQMGSGKKRGSGRRSRGSNGAQSKTTLGGELTHVREEFQPQDLADEWQIAEHIVHEDTERPVTKWPRLG